MDKNSVRRWAGRIWRLFAISVIAFSLVGLYATIALNLKLFNPVSKVIKNYSINDFFYQVLESTGTPEISRAITIVDMADHNKRREIASAIADIVALQPKVVAVDMVFEGQKEDSEGDSMIVAVAMKNPNLIFSYKIIDDSWDGKEFHQASRSFFADSLAPANQGFTNMPRDLYVTMKRSLPVARPLNGEMCPSIIKQVAERYADQELIKAEDRDIKINFSPMVFQVLSADSLTQYPELITDRIVMFGTMQVESDMHDTPVGKIAGVKLLAYSVDTLLRHKQIKEIPVWLLCLVSILIVMVTHSLLGHYDRFAKSQKYAPLRIFLKLTAVKGLIKFFWMALLLGIAFLLFYHYNLSVNLTYAAAAVVFTSTGEEIFNAFKQ